jgi:cyclophilin family peptidyl-prolyl cis-trans isomerase
MIRSFLLSFCCLLAMCLVLSAQESASYPRTEQEAAALGPKNKAFADMFAEYRELAKQLTALKVEYQDAKPDRRKVIDTEYPRLYKQGTDVHKKLVSLALEAHEETPNRNPLVINLLYSTIGFEFNRENYEEAYRLFKRLAVSGVDKDADRYYVFGALAALLTMHYEDAEAWLKKAMESGDLEKTFRDLAQTKAGREHAHTLQIQLQVMPKVKEAWAKEQAIQKAETEAGAQDPAKKLPRVELTTSKGKIVLELFENEAPNTVANFISLVEKGFYNGVVFHRVLPTFMAQGGDPTGTGRGGPGYAIDCECGNKFPQQRQHFRGSISMANAGPNTNGSQFFLTFVPTSFLDGKHTVFGRVVEGFEVLADIQRVDPSDEEAKIPELDKIVEAKVLNKRDHDYKVKKNNR